MRARLYLYDDSVARQFQPFALTRPVSELVAGAMLIRERWERVFGLGASGFISSPHLNAFEEFDAPPALAPDSSVPAGSILCNSRCVIALDEKPDPDPDPDPDALVWTCDGVVCAVRIETEMSASLFQSGSAMLDRFHQPVASQVVRGRWLTAVWDLVAQLSPQLTDDIAVLGRELASQPSDAAIIGMHSVTVETGAKIEPYVVMDARAGPILVRAGATVSSFTRIVGPCYVGPQAVVMGDRIANCSIGPVSKVRGEMSSSIVLGHSNKGHTGFIGHSYLGRWVNLGAGTTTSNLKNTYGTVQLWTPDGLRDTGQQFLGTLFGDHAKTGIGTLLTTGTVVGAGASVFGSTVHSKHVPPFAWGESGRYGEFDTAKFNEVAERAMQRRDVQLSDAQKQHFARLHTLARDFR